MRDYWLTQDLLKAAGFGFIALSLVGIGLALWLPKKWWGKLLAVFAVIFLVSIPVRKGLQEIQQQRAQADEYKERYTKAKALFDERCKTAGEKIYKTVDNVEGVLLLDVRQPDVSGDHSDPMWPDAALAHEHSGDWYIGMFLFNEYDVRPNDKSGVTDARGQIAIGVSGNQTVLLHGYHFVDVKQPNGSVLRYRLKEPNKSPMVTEPVTGKAARYSVGFVNHVNPQDRAQWVAGTTITLTDTQTNEVVATRESYAFEPGLGSTAGGRQPWVRAETCPTFHGSDGARTRFFVDKILKPKQGE